MAGRAAPSSSFVLLASLLSAALLFDVGEAGPAHKVVDPQWHQATATWYGSADGDGSDGKLLISTTSYHKSTAPPVTLTSLVESMRVCGFLER
jgi:hypothetical protein